MPYWAHRYAQSDRSLFHSSAGGLTRAVGALVLDAERDDVLPRAVRALDLPAAHADELQAAVPALEDDPAAAHREVLAGVGPSPVVHVEVLDRAGQAEGGGPAGGAVRGGRVVHEDLHGPPVVHRQDAPVRPCAPSVAADDRRAVHGPRRGHVEPAASSPPPARAMPPSRNPRRDTRPTRTSQRPPTIGKGSPRTGRPHTARRQDNSNVGRPDRGRLPKLPIGNTLPVTHG